MGELITQKEACEALGITRKTMYVWRSEGLPVVWANNGKYLYLYDLSTVKRWMKQNNKILKK